jgi:hypothetical protein
MAEGLCVRNANTNAHSGDSARIRLFIVDSIDVPHVAESVRLRRPLPQFLADLADRR